MGWSMNDFYRWGRTTIDFGASTLGVPLSELRSGPVTRTAQPMLGGDTGITWLVLIGVAAVMLMRR